jgi:hypothetical protein
MARHLIILRTDSPPWQGDKHVALVSSSYHSARTMTDAAATLRALAPHAGGARDAAVAHFHGAWRHDPLVLLRDPL